MHRRRAFLAGVSGALPLAAGCASAPGSRNTVQCPETTTSGGDLLGDEPAKTWRLGDPIENPHPHYKPRRFAVASFNQEREVSITVTRDDADGPVFDRAVAIDVQEYVRVDMVEPDVWTATVTLPDGASKSETFTRFDCNYHTYGVAVRCDGRFSVFGGMSLQACPKYPVNESGNATADEPPGTSTSAGR